MDDAVAGRVQSLFLVYGPSGAGKTTALQGVRSLLPTVRFGDLDNLVKDLGIEKGIIRVDQRACDLLGKLPPDEFFAIGKAAAQRFQNRCRDRSVVLDVGAGFLECNAVGSWLSDHPCIVFEVSSEIAYDRMRTRNPGDSRTFDQYCAQEFCDRRHALYKLATYTIDATRSSDEVRQSLLAYLRPLTRQAS